MREKIDKTTNKLYEDFWLNVSKPKFKEGFERFFRENGHYPTAIEIDKCDYLPTTRLLQRNYGGLANIRKELGLEILDYTKGETRSKTATIANNRAKDNENEIYKYLVEKFGIHFIHREHPYSDVSNHRADFKVFAKDKIFIVDVFYPKDKESLYSCLNSKIRKYDIINQNIWILPHQIIFLQMNNDLSSEISEDKKNKMHPNQSVMSVSEFKKFCSKLQNLKLSKDEIK